MLGHFANRIAEARITPKMKAAEEMYEALVRLNALIDFDEPVPASGRIGYVDDPSAINAAFVAARAAIAKAEVSQ